jgi:hypothetical protein
MSEGEDAGNEMQAPTYADLFTLLYHILFL